jgi:hypothetical protein
MSKPHPNTLPESKQCYLRTLMLGTTGRHLKEVAVEAALIFYHGEVPLARAKEYLAELKKTGVSDFCSMAFEPAVSVLRSCNCRSSPINSAQGIVALFESAGATMAEALQAAQVLSTKLSRHS